MKIAKIKFIARTNTLNTLDEGVNEEMTIGHANTWLEENPEHSLVITHSEQEYYVFRGASEANGNFFWGNMPAEDPNDAEGGDLTGDEAIKAVLAQ